jgi:hypothetical protein
MSRRFLLSPLTIIGAVLLLAAVELACGTALMFVAMMAVALVAISVTYNMLGGLGTIGGVVFASFALNTLVIGQFAKVFFLEAADQGLRSPNLTITVYAVFFLSLMAGVFLFGWIRLNLPRPLEPMSSTHSGVMFATSFSVGLVAQIYMTAIVMAHPERAASMGHGLARAFAMLLPLSLVLAVDSRIRKTDGQHCVGGAVLLAAAAMEFLGFISASRKGFAEPVLLIALTCYFRRFQFRRRHYLAAGALTVLLFGLVSPYYLWSRNYRHQTTIGQQITTMIHLLEAAPGNWASVEQSVHSITLNSATHGVRYFSRAGTVTLARFALIAPDSAVISATADFHWGFTAFLLDVESGLPHFLYPNKPDVDGSWYRASVGGLQSSQAGKLYATTTIIADAWGAFAWPSVVLVALLLVPLLFIVYDSMFDISRPWGTVTTVTLMFLIAGNGVGNLLIHDLLEVPIYVLLVSWFVGWITRYIPMSGDAAQRRAGPLFGPTEAGSAAD